MIAFKDFAPAETAAAGFFSAARYERLEAVLAEANAWIESEGVRVLNVETVVLPNVWRSDEEGTTDPSLRTSGEMSSHWHQLVRVWYERV